MDTRRKTKIRYRAPLQELVKGQQDEVEKYKWIESEKAGHDIGWERAIAEWLEKHFPDWERNQRDRVLNDALRATAPRRRVRRF